MCEVSLLRLWKGRVDLRLQRKISPIHIRRGCKSLGRRLLISSWTESESDLGHSKKERCSGRLDWACKFSILWWQLIEDLINQI